MRLVFWNSIATESVRAGNEKRRALYYVRSSKNQTDEALSIILSIYLYCKMPSHNPKGGYENRKKEEKIPVFDHTYCIQGLNITTSQNSMLKKTEIEFVPIQSHRPFYTFS